MKKIIVHIPNAITCLNLLSGCFACLFAFKTDFETSALFICLAALFDFMDGFAARLLNASSPMGKELDSLADLISFGMAPGILIFSFTGQLITPEYPIFIQKYFPYLAFLIPVFSGLRLAKFNIDTRQTTSFIGLPVPADALFWIGVCFWGLENGFNIYVLGCLILIFSYLLVSELPMFSLKFKDLSLRNNYIRYILLLGAIIFITLFGFGGFAAAIVLYIVLSVINIKL